ncbi:MAG TPA: SoxR reducing system RseC family protein [Spirochaetales bacterium]|nr:SoxR reducing system RseC family protein [Spirochaetales bacterium]HOV37608.1 SoxR reducing system RseC family protein [Spirochaetales bacterium]
MKEIGTVTRINGDTVMVECKPSAACESCKGGLCSVKNRTIPTRNIQGILFTEGDWVEISVPSSQTLSSALRVFGVPVVLFGLFYGGSGYLWMNLSEGGRIGTGLLGMVIGFGVMFFRGRNSSDLPVIVRKIDKPPEVHKG